MTSEPSAAEIERLCQYARDEAIDDVLATLDDDEKLAAYTSGSDYSDDWRAGYAAAAEVVRHNFRPSAR